MPEIKKTDQELLLDEIKGLIADSQKDNVKAADLEKKVADINKDIAEKLDNAGMAALKTSVDDLLAATAANAAAIKAMNETASKKDSDKPVSFKDALVAAIMAKKDIKDLLTEKNDDYGKRLSLKEYFTDHGHKNSPEFIVKTEMLESSIVQSNVATVRLTELDPKRVGIPLTIYPHVTDWMPSKTIRKTYMSILVVYTYSDGAATKTEGSASTISSFLLKTVEFKAFFIATYFTLSDETLDDLEEAMEEIAITAPSKILDKVDTYVLGSAGNDTTAIAGILSSTKKTDFLSATTYAASINNANIIDVIATMKLQCESNKYLPDAVLMSPTDVNKLGAAKDQLDNSIRDRRVVFDITGEPTSVCGMKILKSTAITADDAVVLDSKQVMLGKRKDMTMEIGYNGTDLTEGQKTVVIKVRIAFGVRDAAAVIYTNGLAAAVSAITIV
jgi:hypothetical protein